jgi:hypothetical protein
VNPRRAYDHLLLLYPRDYRATFAAEMAATFEEAAAERRGLGKVAFARFFLAELIGLARGAVAERMAKLAADVYRSANLAGRFFLPAEWLANLVYTAYGSDGSFRSRCAPDLRMMRPVGVPREVWYGALTYAPEELGAIGKEGASRGARQPTSPPCPSQLLR